MKNLVVKNPQGTAKIADEPVLGAVYDFELNGKKYKRIEKKKTRMPELPPILMMMMSLMAGGMEYGGRREPEMPSVNIVKEFQLIQQKKSKLSKSQRDRVEHQFNSKFYEVR
jgi:hypothetical protein